MVGGGRPGRGAAARGGGPAGDGGGGGSGDDADDEAERRRRISQLGREALGGLSLLWNHRTRHVLDLVADAGSAHLVPRLLYPGLHPDRLGLPTAHLWGRRDPLRRHSELLARLCDADAAATLEHAGGHHVSQSDADARAFAALIDKTILRSEFGL